MIPAEKTAFVFHSLGTQRHTGSLASENIFLILDCECLNHANSMSNRNPNTMNATCFRAVTGELQIRRNLLGSLRDPVARERFWLSAHLSAGVSPNDKNRIILTRYENRGRYDIRQQVATTVI
jgi:hypothetical protein